MKKRLVLISLLLLIGCTIFSYACNKKSSNKEIKKSNPTYEERENSNLYVREYDKPQKKAEENKDIKDETKPGEVYYSGKAVVLTYHHVSKKPFSGITITPERFEKDLIMLRDKKFNVISMRSLLNAMEGKKKLPDNAVVISFDDGIGSFYKYAYPLLKKYKMPAVNYIITYRTESYKPSNAELNPLSPDEINEMYSSGLIDIQSHSHNGHDYVNINEELKKGGKLAFRIYYPETNSYEPEEEYKKRVGEDLEKSKKIIYKYIGSYPDMLCFPFGHYNKRLKGIASESGFKYFITTQHGYNSYNSKSKTIYRIRSGDSNLNSEKLFNNIVQCANKTKK